MKNRAIVIGGSIGGLLAGVALAGSFQEVLILEKAELPDEPVPRPSVPQGQHAHGLLAGGLEALEALLPGLFAELERAGCPSGDNLRDAAWIFAGRRLAVGDGGVRGMTLARPLLENAVRIRAMQLPNLRLRTGCRATGLLRQNGRITGLRVRHGSAAEEDLHADLVVDASGRGSKLPEWLEAIGVAPPRVEEVALETRYTSRIYSRDVRDLGGAIALVIVADPTCRRGGIALALDERRWMVSQYTIGEQERPPSDHAGYLAFAGRLASPELAEILSRAEPLGDAATLRFPGSIRRRYAAKRDLPEGLIVCADALSSFNPTFGQGITVAAKQALLLRELRAAGPARRFERQFQRRAERIVDVAWNVAAGQSFQYPGVAGRPTRKMRLANAYLPRVVARAHEDPWVATRFMKTLHFLAAPESLFAPRVLLRVFGRAWHNVSRGRASDPVRRHPPGEGRVPGAR
jgi:2-polyprenyl-6-methoxyphenol hydroxylase-like FAD-dependent oxidoreductase